MAIVDMAQKYSVQEIVKARDTAVLSPLWYQFVASVESSLLLPAWGNAARLYQLRRLWYDQRNTLVTGALVGLKNKIVQTPWELSGPKTRTPHFQEVLQKASLGAGFSEFVSQIIQDYLTLDHGAFIEIIGAGYPDQSLRPERVLGINALDGLRCYPTGDPEYPVYYQSHVTNKLHKLHATRVIRMIDTPSPDPFFRRLGLSAMSRAANVANVMMHLTEYQVNSLDDAPADGIIAIKGIPDSYYHRAKDNFESNRKSGKVGTMRNLLELTSADPQYPVEVQYTQFSQMPQGETTDSMLRNYVNMLALAIGVDPQDIFPLASSAMGSGSQSAILAQKGKAQSYGLILTELERLINLAVLPRNMEFKWKQRDAEADTIEAQTAQQWAGMATTLLSSNVISQEEARKLIANNVEAFGDLLLDEAGQVRLPDDDPKAEETTVDDTTPVGTEPDVTTGEKALEDTQTQFETAIGSLFAKAVSGQTKRDSFGIVARGMIATYGAKAYRDGLRDGGIDPSEISQEELTEISQLAATQSQYVTAVAEAIYEDGNVSAAEAEGKPRLWWNKSMMPFYNAGLIAADKNGSYQFRLGSTEQHCNDCLRLNGQVHRIRDWVKSGWMPQSSSLECGGWRCDCRLEKTKEPITGSY